MARFKNTLTGVVVDVDDDTSEGLNAAYEKVEAPKPARGKRKSEDDN